MKLIDIWLPIPYGWFQVLKVKAESLIPANPDILDGVDDLMQLSYLNEPSVLYDLEYRYNQDIIYVSVRKFVI